MLDPRRAPVKNDLRANGDGEFGSSRQKDATPVYGVFTP